jgi:methylated-DNA-[protein]-cysteine S-methyltransferase
MAEPRSQTPSHDAELSGVIGTPLGRLRWTSAGPALRTMGFVEAELGGDPVPFGLNEVLEDWFSGRLDTLADVAIDPVGTPLQRQVWSLLREIPAGRTATYAALATALGAKESHARAVGSAVAANPLALLIPCHRVIGADGDLTGFAWGTDRKRWILDHEAFHTGRALFAPRAFSEPATGP